MNDTKDKVRYLESLKRHLDELYNDATPLTIINSALPNIMTVIKQMESVSRYYARQGFLGLLCTKVWNNRLNKLINQPFYNSLNFYFFKDYQSIGVML